MTSKSTTTAKKQSKPSGGLWKPHDYQKGAVKFMLQNSCAALFLDPGLGKTSITLAALKVLKAQGMLNKVLVIAPLRVCYLVWPEEARKWGDFEGLRIQILHGKDKEKNLEKEADIYLINPEGLPWLLGADFKRRGFDILVIDESSKFKATNTQRFKLLRPVLPRFRRRYILTGSPAPNGLLDLFGQMFIVDLGYALGPYITHYRKNFFYPSGFGGYEWKLQEGAEKRIQERIKPVALRLSAEDHLDLPALVEHKIYVELDAKARRAYDDMEKELIASMERGEVTAANAAVASGKCRQIANGGVYDEAGEVIHVHDLKAQAVADLAEELSGTPALVAYEYAHDLVRLKKALGKDTPHIGSGVSPKRSAEIAAAWNRGEIPVLLGQPASMGHGLNLQNAGNHVIWHSPTWNFEHFDQFNRRIRRQGSTHSRVFVHYIIARDTIDRAILGALESKENTQRSLLDAIKSLRGAKKK